MRWVTSLQGSPHGGRRPGQCRATHLAPGDWHKEEPQLEESQAQYLQEKIGQGKGKSVLCQHWEDTVESAKNKLRIPEAKKQRRVVYHEASGTGHL